MVAGGEEWGSKVGPFCLLKKRVKGGAALGGGRKPRRSKVNSAPSEMRGHGPLPWLERYRKRRCHALKGGSMLDLSTICARPCGKPECRSTGAGGRRKFLMASIPAVAMILLGVTQLRGQVSPSVPAY